MVSQANWSTSGQVYGGAPDPVMAQYQNAIQDMKRSFMNRLTDKALRASKSVDDGHFSELDVTEELSKLNG